MSGRRSTRSSQPSPSSPASSEEQEEVGVDLSRVLAAVESLTAQGYRIDLQSGEYHDL